MPVALIAGVAYVAATFTVGFGLGILRTLVVAPHVGALAATAIETPLILGASWLICRFLVGALAVPAEWPTRAVMGATAFALLMLVEATVAMLAFGQSLAGHLAHYGEPDKRLGLAAQIVFALMPLAVGRSRGTA
jgi:hypothetical protein